MKKGQSKGHGYILAIPDEYIDECFDRFLIGQPIEFELHLLMVEHGTAIFIYNKDTEDVYCGFQSNGRIKQNIIPDAFDHNLPTQVKVNLQIPSIIVLKKDIWKDIIKIDGKLIEPFKLNKIEVKWLKDVATYHGYPYFQRVRKDYLLLTTPNAYTKRDDDIILEDEIKITNDDILDLAMKENILINKNKIIKELGDIINVNEDLIDRILKGEEKRKTLILGPLKSYRICTIIALINISFKLQYNFFMVSSEYYSPPLLSQPKRYLIINFVNTRETLRFIMKYANKTWKEATNDIIGDNDLIDVLFYNKGQDINYLKNKYNNNGIWLWNDDPLLIPIEFVDNQPYFVKLNYNLNKSKSLDAYEICEVKLNKRKYSLIPEYVGFFENSYIQKFCYEKFKDKKEDYIINEVIQDIEKLKRDIKTIIKLRYHPNLYSHCRNFKDYQNAFKFISNSMNL